MRVKFIPDRECQATDFGEIFTKDPRINSWTDNGSVITLSVQTGEAEGVTSVLSHYGSATIEE